MRLIRLLFTSCFLFTAMWAQGQSPAEYIYGTITTITGDQFEGFIRWGKEEIYWHDLFNSDKICNDKNRIKAATKSESRWSNFTWDYSSIWQNKYNNSMRSFATEFGDIKTLHIKGHEGIDLELKNGAIIKIKGGSNDVGATLRLDDYELGTLKFKWDRIERVDFMQAPTSATVPYGEPIYGILETRRKDKFEGYIKWDLDERTSEDILDGESSYGEQQIEFGHIAEIIKNDGGVDVVLNSGRSMFLDGSNDVDSGNRGIRIFVPGTGNVKVDWRDFRQVRFVDPPVKGPMYNDYNNPEGISAEVNTLDGDLLEGLIIFDVDEMWENEVLDGMDGKIEYSIPFRNITKIIPKNDSYSMVYLCNGLELLLGDLQDVTFNNEGIIIINNALKNDKHIEWEDIEEIFFNDHR